MEDQVEVKQIPQEKLSKKALIEQIEGLDAYIETLEGKNEQYVNRINEMDKEMDQLMKRAEYALSQMEKFYESRTATLLSIMDSAKMLLEKPDFRMPEEE